MTAAATRFLGYRRPDGRVGVRNNVLVLSPTGLTSALAQRVSSLVNGTICVTSGFGRGQVAEDARLHFESLTGLAAHPNIGGVVLLSASQDISDGFAQAITERGTPAISLSLSAVREDALALVDAGVRAAARLVRQASEERREEASLSDLCIAVECGHSDATSGLVCNPLVGRIIEVVVEAGGQAVFSETVEWTGAEHILARRAETPELAARIRRAVVERERAVREAGGDIRGQNPGPQNKAGGLTTIEEKALGAISKGGDRSIRGLLRPAERPSGSGLFLMDTPYFSPESMTAMVAAGAQLVIFTTGAGNSYCSLVAPTVKMSARADAVAALPEQIDIDATGALAGGPEFDARMVARLMDFASGTRTFGEVLGEGNEVVSRLGPSI
ncbi:UxaA family hydrolase [Mesorhizobium sp. 1B3]|uniref:UxaA family hydrolase n=1 Tax=Mesorhizobium sp. 1B3 TaxID=3243599 RepID=UPI003D9978C5